MLVEREAVLATVAGLRAEAEQGRGRLLLLSGEAGVGKSSIVRTIDQARQGACDPVATPSALGPFLEALPELAGVVESSRDRHALFLRVRERLAAAPAVVVLEDLHWADEATLELLRFLGRRLDGLPVLLVATYRDDEVPAGHPLALVLGDLATSPGVVRQRLTPLSADGVQQLLEVAGSSLDARDLHRSTGGNPFFVTEVLAAGEGLPATVRDAVLARTSRLTADAQRVLAAAAVLGPGAELQTVVTVADRRAGSVDEAVSAGILVPYGDGLAFRHELARIAVAGTLAPGELTELHAAALAVLRPTADDGTLAHHAAGCAAHEDVVEFAGRAAHRASRLGAHREAAELLRLALRAQRGESAERAELQGRLSFECYLTDALMEAHAARTAALDLYRIAGDTLGTGESLRWLSRLAWFLGRNAESELCGKEAVDVLQPLGDSHELAMAFSNLSQLRMLAGDSLGATTWGRRALDLAERIDDREARIHALNNIGTSLLIAGEVVEGDQHLAHSLDLALADDAHEHAARAYTNLGSIAVTQLRPTEAERRLQRGIAYCAERDLDSWRLYMSAQLAAALATQGRTDEAAECINSVLRHPTVSPVARITALVAAAQLRVRRGEDAGALLAESHALAAPTGEAQRLVPVAVAHAEAAWLAGDKNAIVGGVDLAWEVATGRPSAWDLGQLSAWLATAGVDRPVPVPVAEPFALLLEGSARAAADAWLSRGAPLWAAHALAASPDLEHAREALALVERAGAPAVGAALMRDRRARGLPVPRGPRSSSASHPAGLTAREVEVLSLLADGHSNGEIAAKLFVSDRTVEHHVSAVLRKLDEPTRARAVAASQRLGLLDPR